MPYRNIISRLPFWKPVIVLLPPLLLYLIVTWPLHNWLIDDAGISFAYARNLGQGHGLVAQPGAPPVEGFSNPLWVILLAPFFSLGLFDLYVTPKVISFIFVGFGYWLIYRLVLKLSRNGPLALPVLIMLSITPPFIGWTCSGLENPLYFCAVMMLTYALTRADDIEISRRMAFGIGLTASSVALTRPDGLLFAAVPIMVWVFTIGSFRKLREKYWKTFLLYAFGFLIPFGTYMIFRRLYFHDWWPNTHYVKNGPDVSELWLLLSLQKPYLERLRELLSAVTGAELWLFVPLALIIIATACIKDNSNARKFLPLLTAFATAVAAYLLLPPDWMAEYRFATPVFPLLYILVAAAAWTLSGRAGSGITRRAVCVFAVVFVLIASSLLTQLPRTRDIRKRPLRVPFAAIEQQFAFKYDQYASELGLNNASVLLPDLGATLYYSRLRIYDLAGLCDRTIARTMIADRPSFYDYVFDVAQPTFIHTHGHFTAAAKLDEDPRFSEDYVAIDEYVDSYATKQVNRIIMSGDYIRKDALPDSMTAALWLNEKKKK